MIVESSPKPEGIITTGDVILLLIQQQTGIGFTQRD
jgi:hypothetical protein